MQKCDQIRNNRYQGDAVWNSPLFHANAAVLLVTTACMAAAVISPKPWAPLIPLWVVFIPWFYLPAQLKEQFGWVAAHATAASMAVLCAIPIIIYHSAIKSNKKLLTRDLVCVYKMSYLQTYGVEMQRTATLEQFEQLVLAAVATLDDAYGVTIHDRVQEFSGRPLKFGPIYSTLNRLENKGYITSWIVEG